jgi:acetyltransferase-like isoleucine patch superfamily enzyme
MPVLNKHRNAVVGNSVYIGRGSMWGNPFVIGKDGTRDDVCEKHAQYLRDQVREGSVSIAQLASLHDKNLVCYCAPLRCHGDTLVRASAWAVREMEKEHEQ